VLSNLSLRLQFDVCVNIRCITARLLLLLLLRLFAAGAEANKNYE